MSAISVNSKAKQVYIRADGNSEIGMGHVMRCISIGEQLRKRGAEVCFLMAGEQAAPAVEHAGFAYIILHTKYRQMESEIPVLANIISEDSVILADSYFVTNKYLQFLGTKGKVAYLDDVNAFSYPVDAIINGNIYGEWLDYKLFYPYTQVWGGLQYSPLREEYSLYRGNRREEYILVTTGGSDPYHLAEEIVSQLLQASWTMQEKICVVCGRFSQSIERLCCWEREEERLVVKSNVPDMWNVMNGAKIAITAGGSTMNELSCMGVPMIAFSFVDNQKEIVRVYREKGYSHYGADYSQLGKGMVGEMCHAAEELCGDAGLRKEYSVKLMNLVDGKGSCRVAEKLLL